MRDRKWGWSPSTNRSSQRLSRISNCLRGPGVIIMRDTNSPGPENQSTPDFRQAEAISMATVLIVEDSRPMQRTLQRLFEADSLQVQIAPDGPSGLEMFRKELPCVVVLDLKLPGISGKELCREFKAQAPSVPIVILSANSEVDDKVLLLELGADDYVTKPFSPKELLARVRRTMRRTVTVPPIAAQ